MNPIIRTAPFLIVSALALAACGNKDPLKITRTDCPAVAVVKNANTLTRFRGFGRDTEDLLWTAHVDGVIERCTEGKTAITSAVTVRVAAQRATAGPAESISVPVFAVVARDGQTLIAKDIKVATMQFADNGLRAEANQTFNVSITDLEKAKGGKYEVLIGFQLTSDEALYNIAR